MTRHSRSALIVSDSATLRRYTASTLEVIRFSCTEAPSGFHAMDCLSERMFDLYLVDLDMAPSDGVAIFAVTLTGGFRDPSPVLIGMAEQPQEQALKAPWGDVSNFAALFAKPFRPDDLIAAAETALAGSQKSGKQPRPPYRPRDGGDPSDL